MKRRNFYLTEEQDQVLESMSELSVSEHLRRAVDEYIAKKRQRQVSISPSKNGKTKR